MQRIYNILGNKESESWNCFNQIKTFWKSKVEVLEEFSNFIKEKSEIDRNYGKSLEKLSKAPVFEKSFGRFGVLMTEFKTSLLEISSTLIGHSDYIEDELYLKIKSAIKEHDSAIKDIRDKAKQLISEREKFMKKNEICKTRYLRISKDQGFSLLKIVGNHSNYLKKYLAANENLNNFNVIFKCELADPIRNFKSKIEEKFKVAKNVLQGLISSEASWIYPLKMHIDSLAVSVEEVFFEEELGYINGLIQQFLDVGLETSCDSFDLDEKPSQAKEDEKVLNKIVEECWDGQQMTEENLLVLKNLAKDPGFRKNFIRLLNNKRRLQLFLIPDNTFKDLVYIFNTIIDSVTDNFDFNCIRQVIILSETFYCQGKVSVHSFIKIHPFWDNEKFWNEFLEDSVYIAIYTDANKKEIAENPEGFAEKANDITKSTLIWYINEMAYLGRDPEFIRKVFFGWKEMGYITDEDFEVFR